MKPKPTRAATGLGNIAARFDLLECCEGVVCLPGSPHWWTSEDTQANSGEDYRQMVFAFDTIADFPAGSSQT